MKVSHSPRSLFIAAILFCAVLLGIGLFAPGTAVAQEGALLISISPDGSPGNGHSASPSLSGDGRYVVFASYSSNLIPGDTNGVSDVFLYDRLLQQTSRVSTGLGGVETNGHSTNPKISGDGRWVVYESLANNIVTGMFHNSGQIYVYDRLTGATFRVSETAAGQPAEGPAANPSISYNGRFAAFFSGADNLVWGDRNGLWDVFIKDMTTGALILASQTETGGYADGVSGPSLALASGGRYLVFASEATNLVAGDTNTGRDIFLYDRVLRKIERIPVDFVPGTVPGWGDAPLISENGSLILMLAGSTGLDRGATLGGGLALYDRANRSVIFSAQPAGPVEHNAALAASGAAAAYLGENENGGLTWLLHLVGSQPILLPGDPAAGGVSLSRDGGVAAYTIFWEGLTQVVVYEAAGSPPQTYAVAGRVTSALGAPLALTTITDHRGRSIFTDQEGYFYLEGYTAQSISLTPQKDGYTFDPPVHQFRLDSDSFSLNFTASPDDLFIEAQKNLGMPYSFDRGCDDPFRGCDGPFQGFYAGYCTDLILDAYSAGLDYYIQFELESDARANPHHFYRWRNARNAHDMWRFFSYTGQMLSHEAPYQPGDVVFFDWSNNGEIDHVAIVSSVNPQNRPTRLYDATGVTPINPGGLAAELDWQRYYEDTVRGHARWTGVYQPFTPDFPPDIQVLQIALGTGSASLRLLDDAGRALSRTENALPGGVFLDLGWEAVASVRDPLAGKGFFTIEIIGLGEAPTAYQLTAQTMQTGLFTGRVTIGGIVKPGEIRYIPVNVRADPDGHLVLEQIRFRTQLKIRGILEK